MEYIITIMLGFILAVGFGYLVIWGLYKYTDLM